MQETKSPYRFSQGIRDSIPIVLGYLSVGFSVGILAFSLGIPAFAAVFMSITNMTSAGQVAGLSIIAAGGALIEIALSQLIINMRYALMNLSLSQKLDDDFSVGKRMLVSFGITDEIYAVSVSKEYPVGPRYMYGIILLPFLAWAAGTLLGCVAGELLPTGIRDALCIAIYGMFIAIIMPPAKRNRNILYAVLLSILISCCIKFIPLFAAVTGGFSIIICAVAASAVLAYLCPVGEKEEAKR